MGVRVPPEAEVLGADYVDHGVPIKDLFYGLESTIRKNGVSEKEAHRMKTDVSTKYSYSYFIILTLGNHLDK